MAIEVRRNGAWVDNTQEKKRVNGAWVSNERYKVMKPTITGVPPFTFKSDGENLRDWSMTGQTVQASTPTPSSPVAVDGVGVRTGNFFNVSDYSVGGTSFITKRITLEPNTAYTMSSNCPLYNVGALIAIGNVDESFTTANNGVYPNHPITRTTDANGELVIGLRTNGSDYEPADYETMLNAGSSPLPYEPYGYKIPITCGGTTTNIYLDSQLMEGDTISKTSTGINIPTVSGSNTLSVGTTVQPSEMSIESISQWI